MWWEGIHFFGCTTFNSTQFKKGLPMLYVSAFKRHFILLGVCIFLLGIGTLVPLVSFAKPVTSRHSLAGSERFRYRSVCSAGAAFAHCHAFVYTDERGVPLVQPQTPLAGSYGPTQFHVGYNLPCSVGGTSEQAVCPQPSSFGGQTIGIVDAYNDPTIQSDLNTYDTQYGLPTCTTSNGCFTIVNQNGNPSPLPTTNAGWALEISLDVETAHEICQTCKILLVEASSSSFTSIFTAENTAARLGASEISNSYGGSEFRGETSYDSYYNYPGVAVTVSSGDNGYGVEYPAASPYVVAVGGTTLNLNSDNTYNSESAWSAGGSGCSAYEKANSWQTSVADWSQTRCSSKRGVADVSADADPNTGAAVYDSTPYFGESGWFQVGGTSLSSPLIAGVFALAGGVGSSTNAQQVPYLKFTSSNSHDVTSGSNGFCRGTIMCIAVVGYDGPTGLGTPNGTSGF
jgi:subtilase family serine protease